MKIVILAMDDPLYTNKFIKQIIDAKHDDIVGFVYVSKGNRMTIGKGKSKPAYLFSLLLIMGVFHFFSNSFITILHKIRIILSKKLSFIPSALVIDYARGKGIKTFEIENPNSKKFLNVLRGLNPDVIINQSQSIIKEELLQVPKIGVINRHNALLPKNWGRLTPFWVLYKGEKETGVSIHFIDEGIDTGEIIVQKKYKVRKGKQRGHILNINYWATDPHGHTQTFIRRTSPDKNGRRFAKKSQKDGEMIRRFCRLTQKEKEELATKLRSASYARQADGKRQRSEIRGRRSGRDRSRRSEVGG